jgi:hypothetical protein
MVRNCNPTSKTGNYILQFSVTPQEGLLSKSALVIMTGNAQIARHYALDLMLYPWFTLHYCIHKAFWKNFLCNLSLLSTHELCLELC